MPIQPYYNRLSYNRQTLFTTERIAPPNKQITSTRTAHHSIAIYMRWDTKFSFLVLQDNETQQHCFPAVLLIKNLCCSGRTLHSTLRYAANKLASSYTGNIYFHKTKTSSHRYNSRVLRFDRGATRFSFSPFSVRQLFLFFRCLMWKPNRRSWKRFICFDEILNWFYWKTIVDVRIIR